jgi:hypothetical protein
LAVFWLGTDNNETINYEKANFPHDLRRAGGRYIIEQLCGT